MLKYLPIFITALALGLFGYLATPAHAALSINNLVITPGDGTATISFDTNGKSTRATITLIDAANPNFSPQKISDTYLLNHSVTFTDLPVQWEASVSIKLQSQSGDFYENTNDMPTLTLGTNSSTSNTNPIGTGGAGPCGGTNSDGSPQPPCKSTSTDLLPGCLSTDCPELVRQPGGSGLTPSGSTSGSGTGSNEFDQSAFEQVLGDFLGQPLLTLGGRPIDVADALRWKFLLLLALATILELFFFAKRRRLWGVVYDARTKLPVEMAVVRLFDQEHHKLLETRVTPKSGRYSFLAEPGEYYLEVTKEGFHFPSRIVDGSIDNEYTNLYLGRTIKLGAGQSLIAPDVPIDSEAGEVQKPGFFRRVLIPVMDKLRLPLLLLVFALALAYQFLLLNALQNLDKEPGNLLLFGSLGLIVILITIEILFVRRGRK